MNKNEWTPIKEYEKQYEINKDGIVRSLHKKNPHLIIANKIDRGGYISVRLSKNGISRTKLIHRLLAETYIPNELSKPEVNHINGIKTDNRIENLEWVTHAENVKHAYDIGLIKSKSCTRVIDLCTGEIYNSIKEAATFLKMNYSTCRNMLYGYNRNTTCLSIAA